MTAAVVVPAVMTVPLPPGVVAVAIAMPTCINVKYSVRATCTYAGAPPARPVVSSAYNTPAGGNRARRCDRNPASSRPAARLGHRP